MLLLPSLPYTEPVSDRREMLIKDGMLTLPRKIAYYIRWLSALLPLDDRSAYRRVNSALYPQADFVAEVHAHLEGSIAGQYQEWGVAEYAERWDLNCFFHHDTTTNVRDWTLMSCGDYDGSLVIFSDGKNFRYPIGFKHGLYTTQVFAVDFGEFGPLENRVVFTGDSQWLFHHPQFASCRVYYMQHVSAPSPSRQTLTPSPQTSTDTPSSTPEA